MSGEWTVLPFSQGPSRQLPGAQFQRWGRASHERMNSSICRCCGEPMLEKGNTLSRNPNICASCSSLADGMEESIVSENTSLAPGQEQTPATPEALARDRREDEAAEPAAHHISISP